jgi:hypothetical protein
MGLARAARIPCGAFTVQEVRPRHRRHADVLEGGPISRSQIDLGRQPLGQHHVVVVKGLYETKNLIDLRLADIAAIDQLPGRYQDSVHQHGVAHGIGRDSHRPDHGRIGTPAGSKADDAGETGHKVGQFLAARGATATMDVRPAVKRNQRNAVIILLALRIWLVTSCDVAIMSVTFRNADMNIGR